MSQRRHSVLSKVCLSALALSLLSRPAHAQAPDAAAVPLRNSAGDPQLDVETRNQAQRLYEYGVEAYREKRYRDAIEAFRRADGIAPSPALSFNSALAYERLQDFTQALGAYRDYLRRAPAATNVRRVQQRVQELERTLATRGVQGVSVRSTPVGATVTLDGIPRGVTPFAAELTPGKHQLELSLRGYQDARTEFVVTLEKASDVELSLKREVMVATSAEAPPREERTTSPKFGPLPWITLGAGTAALLTAGGLELSRRSEEDRARREQTQLGYQDRLESVETRKDWARVFLGVGGALTLTSGVLFYLRHGSSDREEKPSQIQSAGFDVMFDASRVMISHRGSL